MNKYQQIFDLIQTTLSRYQSLRGSDLPKEDLQSRLKDIDESFQRQYREIVEFENLTRGKYGFTKSGTASETYVNE